MPAAEKRLPATLKESHSRSLKTKHRKAETKLSMKRWARETTDELTKLQVAEWTHNKKANTSKGPQGIGSTKK